MEVSFSIGPNSLKVINTLKRSADNINFHTYPDIHSMVKEAMLRHISFDRIIFSTFLLQQGGAEDLDSAEGDLRELNEFIKNYSDNTSIVLITRGSDDPVGKIFSKMFDSPMYTPVIMPKTTTRNLLELVTEDIIKIKTKYYVLDVSKDKTIVSSAEGKGISSESEKPVTPVPEKKKKSGFFSSLMGGKKKQPEISKPVEEVKKVQEDISKVEENVAENVGDFSSGPRSVFTGFDGEMKSDGSPVLNNSATNLFESQSSPSSAGPENFATGSPEGSDEDDMLSLGEMGAEHTDTGFLDEEEEENDEELQAFLKSQTESKSETPVSTPEESLIASGTPVREWQKPVENVQEELQQEDFDKQQFAEPVKPVEPVKPQRVKTNIDIIAGVHGSGTTSAVINEAMDLTQNRGAKVLIIDLDYRENGILSFIDTEAFYTKGYSKGISRRRVYVEDGIGILSNGYGVPITTSELLALLRSGIVRSYDEVLIDCPIECMDIITKDVLKLCNVLIYTNTDRSDLLSTTLGLTNRDYCSLEVERKIMGTCIVDCPDGRELAQEDIDYVKNTCLFANGCWLDNYDRQ